MLSSACPWPVDSTLRQGTLASKSTGDGLCSVKVVAGSSSHRAVLHQGFRQAGQSHRAGEPDQYRWCGGVVDPQRHRQQWQYSDLFRPGLLNELSLNASSEVIMSWGAQNRPGVGASKPAMVRSNRNVR